MEIPVGQKYSVSESQHVISVTEVTVGTGLLPQSTFSSLTESGSPQEKHVSLETTYSENLS